MNRKLRIAGTMLAAAFVMAAVFASAAQANTGTLTSTGPVKLTGTASGVAQAFGFTVECHEHALVGAVNETPHGFVTTPLSTFTVQAEASECVAHIGMTTAPATVTANGCDGVVHPGEEISPGKWAGTTDIVCPGGNQIEIHAYTTSTHATTICTVKIPAQTGLTGGFAENLAGGKIGIGGLGSGIHATKTGILCGGTAETNEASVTGTAVVAGTNEAGEATALSISG